MWEKKSSRPLLTPRRACTVCTGGGKAKPCASLFGRRKENELTEEKIMLARHLHAFQQQVLSAGACPMLRKLESRGGHLMISTLSSILSSSPSSSPLPPFILNIFCILASLVIVSRRPSERSVLLYTSRMGFRSSPLASKYLEMPPRRPKPAIPGRPTPTHRHCPPRPPFRGPAGKQTSKDIGPAQRSLGSAPHHLLPRGGHPTPCLQAHIPSGDQSEWDRGVSALSLQTHRVEQALQLPASSAIARPGP